MDARLFVRDDVHQEDLEQYATGLSGVNLTLDNISSRILYGTIGLICLLIGVVRFSQQINAHIRHVTSFDSEPIQQNYWKQNRNSWWPWLKEHLIYAPLNNKRHNREIQLSSVQNYGTIPGRLHTILLVLYVGSNILYCLMLDFQAAVMESAIAEFRGRTGHLCILNMLALFVLAGRNNPFITILKVSFDTFNLFHRWIGRVIIIEGVAHTLAWLINKHTAMGWEGIAYALSRDPFLQFGLVSTVAMVMIFVLAPSVVRHAAYELFLVGHQVLAFAILVGALAHCQLGPLPQLPYCIAIFCIWFYDRIFRLLKLVARNCSLSRGVPQVVVEALPAEACRVTFHLPNQWVPAVGTHVYAYLPSVSYWQSHPFSVAWSEQHSRHQRKPSVEFEKSSKGAPANYPSSISLVMAARTGMTRKLYERARACPDNTLRTIGFLEGPYGALESLNSYGTVLLFGGGVGITHMMPYLRDLLHQRQERTAAIRKIVLVWTIRERAQLEWIRPWMEQILAMEERRDVLQIKIFVTRPKTPAEVVSPSQRVVMHGGRPQIEATVWETFDNRVGAMAIGVCGPGALADDVRAASRRIVQEGKVDFWEEAFTW